MASRRTRIKGIANIPQRRKNIPTQENVNENDNLTNKQDEENGTNKQTLHKLDDGLDQDSPGTNGELTNTCQGLVVLNDPDLITDGIRDETLNGSVENGISTPEIKPEIQPVSQEVNTPLKRRAFIKPMVSASVFNKKPKLGIEKEESPQVVGIETAEKLAGQESVECIKEKPASIRELNIGCEVTLDEVHLTPQNLDQETTDRGVRKIIPQPSTTVHSDTEYPPPPPSPSRINRTRIKAIPRLGYRKTSFSASESEDESKRNYNRNRNDSVCSTASGVPESIADCLSPQRPKDFSSAIQKKCNRTEQSRKLAEARREFQRRFGATKPDRQRLTMIDLIFYNPTSNPMTSEAKQKLEPESVDPDELEAEDEKIDDPKQEKIEEIDKSDEENEMPVPQIKIGPSGEIILDEKSLVIENKEVKKQREELHKTKVVDGDFDTGYGVYKRQKRAKDWSQSETLRFYKALNTIGSDFTLMCELFPRRTRRELKQKFKKEERINRSLIDKAVMQPCSFDYTVLKHEVEMEEKELEELRRQKEDEVRLRQERTEGRLARKRKDMEKGKGKSTKKSPTKRRAESPSKQRARSPSKQRAKSPSKQRAQSPSKQQAQSPSKQQAKPKTVPQPKPAKVRKVRKPKQKKLDIDTVLEDSDADVSGTSSHTESEEEEEEILPPTKPTRSGRIPRVTRKFDSTQPCSVESLIRRSRVDDSQTKPDDIEPGSIMIISDTSPSGEEMYKFYMVTKDKGTKPLMLDSEIVAKAIQYKKGLSAEKLLTITAHRMPQPEPEEHNVTIPADETVTSMRPTAKKDEAGASNVGASTSNIGASTSKDEASTSRDAHSSTSADYGTSTSGDYEASTSADYGASTSRVDEAGASGYYEASTSTDYGASTSRDYGASTSRVDEGGTSGYCETGTSSYYEAGTSIGYGASTSRVDETGISGYYEAGTSIGYGASTSRADEAGISGYYEAGTSTDYGASTSRVDEAGISGYYEAGTSTDYGASTSRDEGVSASRDDEAGTSRDGASTCADGTITNRPYMEVTGGKEGSDESTTMSSD